MRKLMKQLESPELRAKLEMEEEHMRMLDERELDRRKSGAPRIPKKGNKARKKAAKKASTKARKKARA